VPSSGDEIVVRGQQQAVSHQLREELDGPAQSGTPYVCAARCKPDNRLTTDAEKMAKLRVLARVDRGKRSGLRRYLAARM